MSQYETNEMNLSAIMDGELSGEEICRTIDALIEEKELIAFWKKGRQLNRGLVADSSEENVVMPEGVWDKVEQKSGLGRKKVFKLDSFQPRVWAAAASIILVISFATSGIIDFRDFFQSGDQTVELSSQGGKMSEERFIQLTTEILEADSRYHRKMFEVMQVVNERAYGRGGETGRNVEMAAARPEGDPGQGQQPRRRQTDNPSSSVEFNLW